MIIVQCTMHNNLSLNNAFSWFGSIVSLFEKSYCWSLSIFVCVATNFGVGHQFWCLPAFLRPQIWCFAATKFEVAEKLWTSILVTASPKLVTSFLYFEKKPNLVSLRSRDICICCCCCCCCVCLLLASSFCFLLLCRWLFLPFSSTQQEARSWLSIVRRS